MMNENEQDVLALGMQDFDSEVDDVDAMPEIQLVKCHSRSCDSEAVGPWLPGEHRHPYCQWHLDWLDAEYPEFLYVGTYAVRMRDAPGVSKIRRLWNKLRSITLSLAFLIGISGCYPGPGYSRCLTYGPNNTMIQVGPDETISVYGWSQDNFKVFTSEGTRISVSSTTDIRIEAGDCPAQDGGE